MIFMTCWGQNESSRRRESAALVLGDGRVAAEWCESDDEKEKIGKTAEQRDNLQEEPKWIRFPSLNSQTLDPWLFGSKS